MNGGLPPVGVEGLGGLIENETHVEDPVDGRLVVI